MQTRLKREREERVEERTSTRSIRPGGLPGSKLERNRLRIIDLIGLAGKLNARPELAITSVAQPYPVGLPVKYGRTERKFRSREG